MSDYLRLPSLFGFTVDVQAQLPISMLYWKLASDNRMEVDKLHPRIMTSRFLSKRFALTRLDSDQKRRLLIPVSSLPAFPDGITLGPKNDKSSMLKRSFADSRITVRKHRPSTEISERPAYSIRPIKSLKQTTQRTTSNTISVAEKRPATRALPHGLPSLSSRSWVVSSNRGHRRLRDWAALSGAEHQKGPRSRFLDQNFYTIHRL